MKETPPAELQKLYEHATKMIDDGLNAGETFLGENKDQIVETLEESCETLRDSWNHGVLPPLPASVTDYVPAPVVYAGIGLGVGYVSWRVVKTTVSTGLKVAIGLGVAALLVGSLSQKR